MGEEGFRKVMTGAETGPNELGKGATDPAGGRIGVRRGRSYPDELRQAG